MTSTPPPGRGDDHAPARPTPAPAFEPEDDDRIVVPLIPLLLVLAAIGAIAFAVFGGGDSERTGADPEAEIREVAVTAFTGHDPVLCESTFTDGYLETNFHSSTQTPLERCREAITEDPSRRADTFKITSLTVDGNTATVSGRGSGGNVGQAKLTAELVDDDGWKVSAVSDLDLDAKSYYRTELATIAQSDDSPATKVASRCAVDYQRRHVPIDRVEERLLTGTTSITELAAYHACEAKFRAAMFSPKTILLKTDFTPAQARCIAITADRLTSDADLAAVYTAAAHDQPAPESFSQHRDAAIAACIS